MPDASESRRPISTRGYWRTYTPADGLAALHVEHIVEDREGYLWFATCSGGVSRFDGDAFRTFTVQDGLTSDLIFSLLGDQQGRIWCGTMDCGVCWYANGAFHRFGEEAWCSRGHFNYLFEDGEGRIWCAGFGGIGYCDGRDLCALSAAYRSCCDRLPGYCWGIAQDAEGDLWLGGEDLVRYDGERFARCGAERGLDPSVPGYYAVARDGDGVLWASRGDRLWQCDGEIFHPVAVSVEGFVRKLQTDRDGRLWVCSSGGGALVRDGETFRAFTPREGMAHPMVNSMCQDRKGQFWFATWGGGASCFDPHGCHAPGEDEELSAGEAHALVADGGRVSWSELRKKTTGDSGPIYIGAWEGEARTARVLELQTIGWIPPVLAADNSGALWIGCSAGLYQYDDPVFRRMYPAEAEKSIMVTALATDAEGLLYFGCRHWGDMRTQIIRGDGREFRILFEGELESNLTALAPSRDSGLWFGLGTLGPQGSGAGLRRLDADGQVARWTVADGLVDNRVTDLREDEQGNLWIATLGGLSRFDGTRFRCFRRADGLPSHHLHCLCFDRQGRLWLGSDGALIAYDGRTFQHQWLPQVGTIHDIVEDEEGTLWLAAANGVRCYTPQRISPRVRVLRVLADCAHENAEEVRFSSSVPQLQFEYQGMSLRTPGREMVYTYRLQGYDNDWKEPTRARRALYPALPVGEYAFEVRAIDRDLNYSEPARVRLVVEPDPRLEGLSEALSTGGDEFVGESAALRRLLAQLREIAATDETALILGETGTGKGLAARTLHGLSRRRAGPFVQVNCGVIPEGLVESELFGHERGAFTGAVRRKLGKVELAQGGTLFLDEIGDMPLATQVKLLRLLEEGTFERVGGTGELTADVRIAAATNRDLERLVGEGRFREDLFYRLQVLPVVLPPLRQRREDVPLLAAYFAERMALHLGKPVRGLSREALSLLQKYDWPGNVRELEHAVRRAVVVCRGELVRAEEILLHPGRLENAEVQPAARQLTPEEYEQQYLIDALEAVGWVVKGPDGAAAQLGMAESSLRFRMKKLGIERP